MAPKLPVYTRSGEKCEIFSKTSTPQTYCYTVFTNSKFFGLFLFKMHCCGVLVFVNLWQFSAGLKEIGSLGTTENEVWTLNFNVKAWKTTEHKLHKIWRSLIFCKISAKRAHPWYNRDFQHIESYNVTVYYIYILCSCTVRWNFFEHIVFVKYSSVWQEKSENFPFENLYGIMIM